MSDDVLYLTQIADAIAYIREDTAGGRDSFLKDRRTRQAVYHNLQIIGEAVKRLSPETRQLAPHIPWTSIAGLRDALVHHYDEIDPERIWSIVEERIPRLETAVSSVTMIVQAKNEKQDKS